MIAAGIALGALTVVGIAGFAALLPFPDPDDMARTDVIVVLGAGMDPDGTLHRSSVLRVGRGVALYEAGLAPRMHFTGGEGTPGGPSAGEGMANLAIQMGVPAEATSWEGRSQSTLQNALFSQPMLAHAQRIRLVTEGFHLPRAWLSFRWAGDHEISLAFSERFRTATPNSRFPRVAMVLREAAAFWFNIGRVGAYGVAGLMGVPDGLREGWLE
jgi:uncharacterized SAM-binding protein YcdF (DUF218 family)